MGNMDRLSRKRNRGVNQVPQSRNRKRRNKPAPERRESKSKPSRRVEARRPGRLSGWALCFVLIFLCWRRAEAGRYPGESDAKFTQGNGATTKELKETESYNGQAALLLSSSTDEIAQAQEQTKKQGQITNNHDPEKENRPRYLTKRSSAGTTAPPRTGDGSGTHDQPKRANPETSPPLAESRKIPKGCPSKRVKPDPKRPPAPERVPWLRYLMKRASPGTHASCCGKEATVTDYKGGSRAGFSGHVT